jgi:signal transduction histidine kinase/ActR/RegA family two-component response regulator
MAMKNVGNKPIKAEAAQKQIADILDSIPGGVSALDRAWRFTYINRPAEQILRNLKITREKILGKNIWEVFPDLVGSKFYTELHRAVAKQITVEFEQFYPPLDLWLGVHASPSKEGLSVHFRNVTKRKRAEEERARLLASEQEARRRAEEANSLKDGFLAMISHELRTPLTAMLGWARLLRQGKLDEAAAARAVESIERNAQAQAQLIEDLLDTSRIITGKLHLNICPVRLAEIIRAATDSVRPAADGKGIHIESRIDETASVISGDPDRLQQVVWNLLSNAVKFTPAGGRVEVQLERVDAAYVEIRIRDSGIGISAQFLPHVFDRFRQADSRTTRTHGGLGLGLAIVRHLVELHGGIVYAESPGEGEGATFVVTLPIAAVRAQARASESVPLAVGSRAWSDNPTALDGLHVLIVDDEPDARQLLTIVLEQYGATVTSAASVAEALAALERSRPDVLVSDIGMPGEDGYDLIRKIRTMTPERGGHIPAVALTAYARLEDRVRALSAGYQMHVPKPIEPAELAAVVASVTQRTGHGVKSP